MDILKLLENLGYATSDDLPLGGTIRAGLSDSKYRNLILWLTKQIKQHGEIDETVSSLNELDCFGLELSSFLKELSCPYATLLEGPVSFRFRTESDAMMLVDYLASECATLSILKQKKEADQAKFLVLTQKPSTETDLKLIFNTLNLDVENVPHHCIFDQINERINSSQNTFKIHPLFNPETNLTTEQWSHLEEIHASLLEEYTLRLTMMLKRLDVTVSCFQWKTANAAEVIRVYRSRRRQLAIMVENMSRKDISDLLVADDILMLKDKVSLTRLKGSGKNVFLGPLNLPDRGGKVDIDLKPIMPSWSSREEGRADENLRKKLPKEKKEPISDNPTDKKSKKIHKIDVMSGNKKSSEQ